MRALVLLLLVLGVAACDGGVGRDAEPAAHLREFGFVGVGCDLVRPGAPDGDYLGEVAAFSTTAHLCPRGETLDAAGRDLAARIDRYASAGVRPFLDAGLLFEPTEGVAPSGGPAMRLSPAAGEIWAGLAAAADLSSRADAIAAIYLSDEPTWNGVSTADLTDAAQIVRTTLPGVPLMIVEAAPAVGDLVVPREIEWLGFDRYGVADPTTDAQFQADLAELKARRSRPDQRIVLALDAQWIPLFESVGLAPDDMAGHVGRGAHRLPVAGRAGRARSARRARPAAGGAGGVPGDWNKRSGEPLKTQPRPSVEIWIRDLGRLSYTGLTESGLHCSVSGPATHSRC